MTDDGKTKLVNGRVDALVMIIAKYKISDAYMAQAVTDAFHAGIDIGIKEMSHETAS